VEHGARIAGPEVPLGWFFLERLARLAQLRTASWARLEAPLPELLEHALLSTYDDCVGLGLLAEARRVLGVPEGADDDR
jgi:hypothetical protein